ncbi:MAG: DUF2608 domain-containing protein [Sphingobacteriia bacterium]|nr:DUF2608 domain-containing protein [Sphingobacteriia bacterium]
MLFRYLMLILILSSCTNYNKHPQIKPINSFNEANFDLPKNILVIFDVDETLIQPVDSYLINEHTETGKEFRNFLLEKYKYIKDWEHLTSIMLKQAQRPIIEPQVIDKIKELQTQGVKVIALTGMNTGKMGIYNELAEWRYEHLKSLGFQGSFTNQIIKFDYNHCHPIFFKGVLATDLAAKGPILMEFLKAINYPPKQIVMFDDDLDHLNSVAASCKKHNILFLGYYYKGAKSKKWNQKLIEAQLEHLIKHKEWLDDNEVDKLVK